MNQAEVVIFVGERHEDDVVEITCPVCYFAKSIPLKKLQEFKGLINVKCKCSNTFSVKLEYRQKQRKDTTLEGLFCNLSVVGTEKWRVFFEDVQRTNCTLTDLSVDGVAIVSRSSHSVAKGDRLRLRINFECGNEPIAELDVVVRNVKGNTFGCEFLDKSKYTKKIGFYLM